MINFFLTLIFIVAIYLLPGIALASLFKGHLKKNLFFLLLLSFLLYPFYYLLLAKLNLLTGINWLLLSFFGLILGFLIRHYFPKSLIDTDTVFPRKEVKSGSFTNVFKWSTRLIIIAFFILVIAGKLGLPTGYLPVGDDQPRSQKATSIALSPTTPLFYNFPISDLTIYYFNSIPSGLITKFTQNSLTINQSWFLHNLILTALMLWMINLLATRLFNTYLERFVLVFSLTFSSGLEYFLAFWRGVKENHLEWWTDWIGLSPAIHTQISAPVTLFFWVSHHLFGGLLIIPLYFLMTSKEKNKLLTKLFIGLIFAAMVGYTFFVFMTVAFIYVLFYLFRLIQKKETVSNLLKNNLVIGIVGFLLALPMLLLFVNGGKGHYFIFHSNVFWFLPNNVVFFRPINFILTALLYFLVEFGLLFIPFLIGIWLFWKKKLYQTDYLYWGLFLYVPIWVIFFIKALDDNNISMRSLIPSQVALAVVAALVFGHYWKKYQVKNWGKKILAVSLLLLVGLGSPMTIYEGWNRYHSAFIKVDPIYAALDQQLPLNSIIVSSSKQDKADLISILGHRFSFKDLTQFTVTDFEYVDIGKIKELIFAKPTLAAWEKILKSNPDLAKNYGIYYLGDVDRDHDFSQDEIHSNRLFLRKL